MKIKQYLKPVRPCDRWNDEQVIKVTLVSIANPLDLGNNFTLDHLVTALFEALPSDEFERLYVNVADSVIINYRTRYGKGQECLGAFDFGCYFKHLYDSI